jgi:transaldolase
MNRNTEALHNLGQRLWLDNITREWLTNGTLAHYIDELSVTGLTSNPTIFEHAIGSGTSYDSAVRELAARGVAGEALFFELALQDLAQAADLFRPVHDASGGADGWVSLEVSPLLANDTANTIKMAAQLHARAARPNFFIKIPEKTLLAFAHHGKHGASLPADGGNAEAVIKLFKRAAVDDHALTARLQRDGVAAFAKSWRSMLSCIAAKSAPPAPVWSA